MENIIIGCNGKKGSGKDEVFNIIKQWGLQHGILFQNRKFSEKLKQGLELDFPDEFSVDKWETLGDDYREAIMPSLEMTRRRALQLKGQKLRQIHPDYHINTLMSQYKQGDAWVITDCRFVNEAATIKSKGGIVIRLNRDTGKKDNDISEISLDNYPHFDYIIDNNGTLEELKEQIVLMCHNYMQI